MMSIRKKTKDLKKKKLGISVREKVFLRLIVERNSDKELQQQEI